MNKTTNRVIVGGKTAFRLVTACLLALVLAMSFSLDVASAQRRSGGGGGGSFSRSSGGSFGGGSFGGRSSGSGGSFGSGSSGFGGGSSSSSSFGNSGSFGRSSSSSSFGRSGSFGSPGYTRSSGSGYGTYNGARAYGWGGPSYYWASPSWYYYTPFHPAFYFNPPYMGADGIYQPGGFSFGHLLISIFVFVIILSLIGRIFFGRRNVRYTTR